MSTAVPHRIPLWVNQRIHVKGRPDGFSSNSIPTAPANGYFDNSSGRPDAGRSGASATEYNDGSRYVLSLASARENVQYHQSRRSRQERQILATTAISVLPPVPPPRVDARITLSVIPFQKPGLGRFEEHNQGGVQTHRSTATWMGLSRSSRSTGLSTVPPSTFA